MRRSRILQVLCAACVAVAAAACQRNDDGELAGPAQRLPGDALAWDVERAQATRHIATSTLETRDAAEGSQFVVLDVSVRNPDTQPQVLSEGSLVAIDASQQQRFATPVSMLADEFLTLQVLPPDASARGKIAFEVPEGLTGAWYWTPGNSTRRILLHVQAAPAPPHTLANVEANADTVPAIVSVPTAPPTPSTAAPVAPAVARAKQRTEPASMPPPASSTAGKRIVASVAPSSSARPKAKPAHAHATVIPAAQEQERRARCDALLTRNAQADEALRPFYLLNCPDYPLPPAWHAAAIERSAPISAIATPRPSPSDCGASRAARLVCRDPFLASLDRRLAQSLSRALDVADDPAALRREQDDWRARVRDACGTVRCLELAYGRRTAHIDSLAKTGP